jgi:hypothetical protein
MNLSFAKKTDSVTCSEVLRNVFRYKNICHLLPSFVGPKHRDNVRKTSGSKY